MNIFSAPSTFLRGKLQPGAPLDEGQFMFPNIEILNGVDAHCKEALQPLPNNARLGGSQFTCNFL